MSGITEALFIRNEGIHVAGELALYMAITAVAIAGCSLAHFDSRQNPSQQIGNEMVSVGDEDASGDHLIDASIEVVLNP